MSNGKVIIITGSSQGIGAELLRGFARKGCRVVLNYARAEAEATALFEEIAAFSEVLERYRMHDPENRERIEKSILLERLGAPEDIFNMWIFLFTTPYTLRGKTFLSPAGHL